MQAAFDEMACSYDASFTHTAVGKALREIVWSRVDRVFRPSQHLLELGCGTGEDALRFGRGGFTITATDASPGMIQLARDKARLAAAQSAVEFSCVPMQSIAATFRGRSFDGVFSNFGAVNCVPDLPGLACDLADVLKPGAPLLWVVMGRYTPWEWIWYLSHGKPRKAFRRLQSQGAKWRDLMISYPTPAQLTAALSPQFIVTRTSPLGCALPPSYAAKWLDRSPRALAALSGLEQSAQCFPGLATWSDHYIIEALRRP